MANAVRERMASQFFITVAATPWLTTGTPFLARSVEGQDVADKISNCARFQRPPENTRVHHQAAHRTRRVGGRHGHAHARAAAAIHDRIDLRLARRVVGMARPCRPCSRSNVDRHGSAWLILSIAMILWGLRALYKPGQWVATAGKLDARIVARTSGCPNARHFTRTVPWLAHAGGRRRPARTARP